MHCRNGYHSLVTSDLPVLITSGERDPAPPVAWGEEIQSALPNSRHLVVSDAGHVPLNNCMLSLKQRFIETSTVAGLDVSCVGNT